MSLAFLLGKDKKSQKEVFNSCRISHWRACANAQKIAAFVFDERMTMPHVEGSVPALINKNTAIRYHFFLL